METKTEKKNKTPKLTCVVTGKSRNTTREYLDSRLARLNIDEATFVSHYANKDTIKMLRSGKTVEQIRAMTQSTTTNPISAEMLKKVLAFNGKQPKLVTVKPASVEAKATSEVAA